MFEAGRESFEIVAVVARAKNGVIGRDDAMPWVVRGDLARFRRLTMGRPMIMGRRTLQSIGRVLDGRDTIVLTRAGVAPIDGARRATTPDEALSIAASCARSRGTNEIVIAGGAEIYALFLDRTDRIEMTVIDAEPEGDTIFPPLAEAEWVRGAGVRIEPMAGDSAGAHAMVLTRSRTSDRND